MQTDEYRRMAVDLVLKAKHAPGDMREIIGYEYTIDPYDPWFSLVERKLNVPFIAKELLWYVNGDMYDTSIGDYAGVWRSVLDHDGRAVSNYGQRAFREGGIARAIDLISNEPETRRAIVYFGDDDFVKLHSETKDQPCANSIHWIRRGIWLYTIVSQRSQDYIYGVSGDAVVMSLFTAVVAKALNLRMAPIQVQVASFHHYPKHKDMVHRIMTSDRYSLPWPLHIMTTREALEMAYNTKDALKGPFMSWVKHEADKAVRRG